MKRAATFSQRIQAVVIGASAGGVEALSALLPALPAALPVAVLVVLHVPREGPSLLVEVFAPRCALRVQEAQDKEPVEPGVVYFAAPGYHLLVDAGPTLALSVDDLVNFSRPSIDVLFESAAHVYGRHLLGIVLTGGNADGAEGLAQIGRAGGVTVVQTPGTAVASAMPAAALECAEPDYVLSLGEIADLLKNLGA